MLATIADKIRILPRCSEGTIQMAYFFALSCSLFITLVLDYFFLPCTLVFYKRSIRSLLITCLLISSLFFFALLITQRPYFSLSLNLLGIIVVLVVSNTKFKTLREPLVFSDFFLYLQAIKHPRLYLPFLGVFPLVGLVTTALLLGFSGFYFEMAKFQIISSISLTVVGLCTVSFFLLRLLAKQEKIVPDISEDSHRLGVLATLCCYGFQAANQRKKLKNTIKESSPYVFKEEIRQSNKGSNLADIVVVQSESFFDARIMTKKIKSEVLTEYDVCLLESVCHGHLQVPAWGANTMRTEFAFLTGLESKSLGLAQYYPYQQLIDMKLPSIVSELSSKGYWCVCIHPNASSFFMRDKFFKHLGFDDFIDAEEFEGAKREGPYISDLEVSEKIKQSLNKSCQPCFIFAITMENHGPLHLESVREGEWQDYYDIKPQSTLDDLTVYLRHLKNADLMIQQQLEFFKARERKTVFALYGDHVPAISHVFESLDYDDPRSNYFIWSSSHSSPKEESQIQVESLGQAVLRIAESLAK